MKIIGKNCAIIHKTQRYTNVSMFLTSYNIRDICAILARDSGVIFAVIIAAFFI